MAHYKTELILEFPGFVLFDPVVLQEFLLEKGIEDDDLLKYFNKSSSSIPFSSTNSCSTTGSKSTNPGNSNINSVL